MNSEAEKAAKEEKERLYEEKQQRKKERAMMNELEKVKAKANRIEKER